MTWTSVQPTTANDLTGIAWTGRRFVSPGAVTSMWISKLTN